MNENERFIDPASKDGDNVVIRPSRLNEFIGQSNVIDNLKIFIQAAKLRKESIDHILFYGPPGLGKTTLANIISKEMGVGFKTTAGPLLNKAGDLAAILTNLEKGDVLFIDEIHRLNPLIEEVLYPAMEDFTLDIIIGEGVSARTVKIDLEPFTLVGATTRVGTLTNPLRDRFGINLRMEFYTTEELQSVVERGAKILNYSIDKEGSLEISKRSRGTPRIALRLLKRVRDFAMIEQKDIITKDIASSALLRLEVDDNGFDNSDYRYMNFILNHYKGGPVGIDTIAAGLSEHRNTIEDTIEPFLIQKGFINRTSRGRVLTETAIMYLSFPKNN